MPERTKRTETSRASVGDAGPKGAGAARVSAREADDARGGGGSGSAGGEHVGGSVAPRRAVASVTNDGTEGQRAASMIEDVLLTPRVLNVGRYNELADELRSLIREASERSAELRRAGEELRATQAQAARTLDELRTRTESIGRTVATIDQRLARGEALAQRATEQAQASQEAAARVEALTSRDTGEIERRIAASGRTILDAIESERTTTLARIEASAAEIVPTIERMLGDGRARIEETTQAVAKARAEAIATHIATHIATGTATEIAEGVAERAITLLEERAAAIRRSLLEDTLGKASEIERTTREAIEHAAHETAELLAQLGRGAHDAVERTARASDEATSAIERAERLVRPETLEPVRNLARELGQSIGQAEQTRATLEALLARTTTIDAPATPPAPTPPAPQPPLAPHSPRSPHRPQATPQEPTFTTEVHPTRGEAAAADAPAAQPITTDAAPDGHAACRAEIDRQAERARMIVVALDERLSHATTHAERLNAWIAQTIAHAHQTGGMLEALVMRTHLMTGRGALNSTQVRHHMRWDPPHRGQPRGAPPARGRRPARLACRARMTTCQDEQIPG